MYGLIFHSDTMYEYCQIQNLSHVVMFMFVFSLTHTCYIYIVASSELVRCFVVTFLGGVNFHINFYSWPVSHSEGGGKQKF